MRDAFAAADAFIAAIRQLADPPIRRVIWRVALWTAAVFAALGAGLIAAVAGFDPVSALGFITIAWIKGPLMWLAGVIVAVLGGFVFFAMTWLLFVAVVQVFTGFYLEGVIAAVEARHYPDLPPANPPPLLATLGATARYFGAIVGLNLIAVPFYLIPVVGLVVFYALNGYLLGREYFELVAMRRHDAAGVRTLRRSRRFRLFAAGLLTTLLLSLPVLNLAAIVIAAAAMVHLVEGMQGRAVPDAAA